MSLQVGQKVRRVGGAMADGQLGHVVTMEDGSLGVKLDRHAESLIVPLRGEHEWRVETRSQLQPMQLARVAYGADRELRIARGEYGVKEWMSLSERDRLAWMQAGPPEKDEDRRRLYVAILRAVMG